MIVIPTTSSRNRAYQEPSMETARTSSLAADQVEADTASTHSYSVQ